MDGIGIIEQYHAKLVLNDEDKRIVNVNVRIITRNGFTACYSNKTHEMIYMSQGGSRATARKAARDFCRQRAIAGKEC